jgi:hypothetical protein
MSRGDFQRLRTVVLDDERLQERLRAASTHGEDALQAGLVAAAAARGLQVDAGDVGAALAEARRAWTERWLW